MRFIFPTIFTSPQTFTSSGSWEVPDGITNICIEAWGRGGDSGRVKNYNYHTNIYAGAGGGAQRLYDGSWNGLSYSKKYGGGGQVIIYF